MKGRMPRSVLTQSVVSLQYAEQNNLLILTTNQYGAKFFVTQSAVLTRIRKRKLRAFKSAGKWYVVLPEKCPTGFEYPGI